MKPEPLKNKARIKLADGTPYTFYASDILAAVGWLKAEIDFDGSIISLTERKMILERIDKAFEDVIKKY